MKYRVLDITRTISRVGVGHPTGIDRVERAYICEFLKRFPKTAFLAKLSDGYFVLNAEAMQQFVLADFGNSLSSSIGIKDALRLKLNKSRRRAQSFVRKRATALNKANTAAGLSQCFTNGFEYTNVGHSNLSGGFLSALKKAGCEDIRIMIHDMIPLDFPEYCKPQTPQDFLVKMQAVATYADEVICNSEYTKSRVQTYFADWPNTVSYVVAYLGVDVSFTDTNVKKSKPPQFMILGTIEPRKNHVLLLDVWALLSEKLTPDQMPVLNVVGKRGWQMHSFFERLSKSPMFGTKIFEYNDLNDDDLNDMLNASTALLFPSIVEGYGLPAIEALALKIPVLCSDISVFKELLGEKAHMLPNDTNVWAAQILEILQQSDKWNVSHKKNVDNFKIPTWSAHFRHVYGEYESK